MTLPISVHPTRRRGGVRIALLAAVALLTTTAALNATPGPASASVPAPPAGLHLVFSDDFTGASGAAVNGSNWQFATGHGYPGGAANWGTGEVENMTSSTANAHLNGSGQLVIKAIRDGGGNWTSSRLETRRTDFAAPAGGKMVVEASLQQPNVSGAGGAGYWPAFWMLGAAARPAAATNWPGVGEIDVMEDINGRSSEFATLHCGVAPGGPCNEFTGLGSGERGCGGCQTGYHKYTMLYDRTVSPERLAWYLDGVNIHNVYANQVPAATWNAAVHHGFFIILNLAMGGSFPGAFGGGPTAATANNGAMLVGYVAVWTT
jgi:beta-glucanase (GH16 family)